jgi:hypothetical protein
MISRVVANDVDNRSCRAARVVEIGKAVGETWSKMQQGRRRLFGHAAIAVRHAGRHALEQSQHRPHAPDPVECGDEMHFRCARI